MQRLRSPLLASVVLALALTLLSRAYEGIRHDGTLYFGQLLLRHGASVLASDPFFLGGSQDSYSLFSQLLHPSVACAAWTFPLLVLAGIVASALAIVSLVRQVGGDSPAAVFGLVAAMCASPLYGGLHLFSYTEAFLTARTLAEPLVLWSLLFLASRRLLPALGLQLAAAAFHPLMALPAVVMTWLLAVVRDRRWLLLLAVPLLALASASTGRVPWAQRLLQVYDPYWWALVSQANTQVLTANWTLSDWLTIVTDMAVLAAVASRLADLACRQLVWALLATAMGLMPLAIVATDVLHWVLPTQLQLWRVLWLVHLLSLAFAPWLVWRLWTAGGLARLTASLVVLALVSSHAASAYGAPILAGWLMCEWGSRRGWPVSTALLRFGMFGCALAALGLSAAHLDLEIERLHWNPPLSMVAGIAARVLNEPVFAIALTALVMLLSRRGAFASRSAWGVSLAVLAFSAVHWDQRDALAMAVENPPAERPFQALIPPDASVFWPDHLPATWGLLQRVSHYERQQGAGSLFNRATAEIIAPRREAYRRIRQEKEACEVGAWMNRGTARDLIACQTPPMPLLQALCSGDERPDFLIFDQRLSPPALATWAIGDQRFHLYRCSQFAAAAAQPAVQNDRRPADS
ncbi:MAG TPA: hypothetical protein VIN03_04990 [Roseateles sp.]